MLAKAAQVSLSGSVASLAAIHPLIVYPEDFRKTLARLSVAVAGLDFCTKEDFTQVIARPESIIALIQNLFPS